MIAAWKIRHKQTGLFFTPTKHHKGKTKDGYSCYNKTNLTKSGKIYHFMPSNQQVFAWFGLYYHPYDQATRKDRQRCLGIDEFEIVEL